MEVLSGPGIVRTIQQYSKDEQSLRAKRLTALEGKMRYRLSSTNACYALGDVCFTDSVQGRELSYAPQPNPVSSLF